jgi:hypothetical protein
VARDVQAKQLAHDRSLVSIRHEAVPYDAGADLDRLGRVAERRARARVEALPDGLAHRRRSPRADEPRLELVDALHDALHEVTGQIVGELLRRRENASSDSPKAALDEAGLGRVAHEARRVMNHDRADVALSREHVTEERAQLRTMGVATGAPGVDVLARDLRAVPSGELGDGDALRGDREIALGLVVRADAQIAHPGRAWRHRLTGHDVPSMPQASLRARAFLPAAGREALVPMGRSPRSETHFP